MKAVSAAAQPCEMCVCIDREPVAFVLACTYEKKRPGELVCPVGSDACAAVAAGACTYEVTLRQFTTAALEDRWTAKKGFELSVQTERDRLRFTGCEWLEIRNQITAGGSAVSTVRLAACTMIREGL